MRRTKVKYIPWVHPQDVQEEIDSALSLIDGEIKSVDVVPVPDPQEEYMHRDIIIRYEEA